MSKEKNFLKLKNKNSNSWFRDFIFLGLVIATVVAIQAWVEESIVAYSLFLFVLYIISGSIFFFAEKRVLSKEKTKRILFSVVGGIVFLIGIGFYIDSLFYPPEEDFGYMGAFIGETIGLCMSLAGAIFIVLQLRLKPRKKIISSSFLLFLVIVLDFLFRFPRVSDNSLLNSFPDSMFIFVIGSIVVAILILTFCLLLISFRFDSRARRIIWILVLIALFLGLVFYIINKFNLL